MKRALVFEKVIIHMKLYNKLHLKIAIYLCAGIDNKKNELINKSPAQKLVIEPTAMTYFWYNPNSPISLNTRSNFIVQIALA